MSFISLDSIEPLESFQAFYLPFFPYIKKSKFDLPGSFQKMRSFIVLPGYIDTSKKGPEKYEYFFVP